MVKKEHDFIYLKTPQRWYDGIPMGNGFMGAMLWGDGNPLRITLDDPLVWETRETLNNPEIYNYENIKKLVKGKKWRELNRACHSLPEGISREDVPYPTHIPLPRMEIKSLHYKSGRLSLSNAMWFTDSGWLAFMHAKRKLFIIKGLREEPSVSVGYLPKTDPSIGPDSKYFGNQWGWPQDILPAWGYPALERGKEKDFAWVRQALPDNGEYVIAWMKRGSEFLVTISNSVETANPFETAKGNLTKAPSFEVLQEEHLTWWKNFWERSSLTLPDKKIENLYYAELYKMGSCSRPEGPAISLCGMWPHDQVMPWCRNDYHLDWNIQAAYWLVYASNHLDLGFSLYNNFTKMLPRFSENCRNFYGTEGLHSPCTIGPNGISMSSSGKAFSSDSNPFGWEALGVIPSMLPWVAHNFWLHFRYSGDKDFLKHMALPLLKGCWKVYKRVLEEGDDGFLHLPLAHSPEYGECSEKMWQVDTSFDAAIIRFLCRALIEAEEILGESDPLTPEYNKMLDLLYDYPGNEDIWIAEGLPFEESHRHHCHLVGLYPLEELNIESSSRDRRRIEKSMLRILQLGTENWAGHAYTAYSLIAARAGLPDKALKWLQDYCFLIKQNTMPCGVDYRKPQIKGLSVEYMEIDEGFSAAAAVLEMLLQSWGGLIRIFPAVPDCWKDVSFSGLMAEGNVLVSAERKAAKTVRVELKSLRGGKIKIKNNFQYTVTMDNKILRGDIFEIYVEKNQTVVLIPSLPADSCVKKRRQNMSEDKNFFGLKNLPPF